MQTKEKPKSKHPPAYAGGSPVDRGAPTSRRASGVRPMVLGFVGLNLMSCIATEWNHGELKHPPNVTLVPRRGLC